MTINTAHFSSLSADELYGILRLRAEVFVVEQDCPYQDLDDRDRDSYQVWATDGGETVGCLRVFMYDSTYAQIGRVVTSTPSTALRNSAGRSSGRASQPSRWAACYSTRTVSS